MNISDSLDTIKTAIETVTVTIIKRDTIVDTISVLKNESENWWAESLKISLSGLISAAVALYTVKLTRDNDSRLLKEQDERHQKREREKSKAKILWLMEKVDSVLDTHRRKVANWHPDLKYDVAKDASRLLEENHLTIEEKSNFDALIETCLEETGQDEQRRLLTDVREYLKELARRREKNEHE